MGNEIIGLIGGSGGITILTFIIKWMHSRINKMENSLIVLQEQLLEQGREKKEILEEQRRDKLEIIEKIHAIDKKLSELNGNFKRVNRDN